MIHEAIDTAVTLGWALLVWIVLTAAFATGALYAVVAVAWWVARTVWALLGSGAALYARLRREQPSPAPEPPGVAERRSGPRIRPAPSWARTDTEEAA